MAIVLGIASVLIVVMTVLAIRVLLYAGVFVLFLVWLQLIVIGVICAGVGAIAFALLYQFLGAENAGFVWAGAIAVGLMVGWWLLTAFAGKVVGWGRRFVRKREGVAWQMAKSTKAQQVNVK